MELRHLPYFVAVGEEQQRRLAFISLSRPCHGRSRIWRRRWDSRCSTDCHEEFD